MNNANGGTKPRTKSEIYKMVAEKTGLSRKQVVSVFDNLTGIIKKPATKARMGVNPFTGQEMMFKAKPARKVVKAQPLKALKTMV